MEPSPTASQRISRIVLQRLESLVRAGVAQIGKGPAGSQVGPLTPTPNRPAVQTACAVQDSQKEAMTGSPPPGKTDQGTKGLSVLEREVAACTRCRELATSRTQTVFGVGDGKAKLCFLGEAPGADEDRQGEPFVGRAGQLLTDIIHKGMGIRREDVYILNVLKCRPPGNRNPEPDEVANCRSFFEGQLKAIRPEFICCLGAVAAHALLQTTEYVGKLRGRFHDYQGSRVVVTYHPSYLLRTPSAKKKTWEDIQMLMREMGLPLPKQKTKKS